MHGQMDYLVDTVTIDIFHCTFRLQITLLFRVFINYKWLNCFVGNEALKKAKQKAVLDAAFRDGGRSSRDRKDQESKKEFASVDSDEGTTTLLVLHLSYTLIEKIFDLFVTKTC